MTAVGILQMSVYFLLLLAMTKPLGLYMARVFEGRRTALSFVLRPVERAVYRLTGVDETTEQRWTGYAGALLAVSFVSFIFVYLLQRFQGWLPLNPMGFGTSSAPANATSVSPDLAFNTAVSFMSNTNWQAYGGEATLSYFVQMAALTVQNFISAAAGVAVAIAFIRGFVRRQTDRIGNFWVDLTRGVLYVFLPLAFLFALVLVWQGVPQTFHAYPQATTLEGASQTIASGPIASQEAIKMLGTNGGGFLNANSAAPYENPTPLSNYLETLAILLIPAALTYTFGVMVKDTRQGWALFAAMSVIFFVGLLVAFHFEQTGNPNLAKLGIESEAANHPGGNMEGKETRFGIASSVLFATATTAASNGAVNSMHDSYTPLGGFVPLFNIQLGEVVFGGVGSGLYGMLLFAILAVFIAGLMVGRTPEYLGKKIEAKEVKMAMIAMLATAIAILLFASISSVARFDASGYWNAPGAATANLNNRGPHGLSEVLYAFSSGAGNNGSAFGGINVNTPWYNLTIGLSMLLGRFLVIIPVLAAAGSLAAKKTIPASAGTFPTHGPLFIGLLIGTIFIIGALTFFPVLSLGPIVEHFLMHAGRLFSLFLSAPGLNLFG